MHLVGIFANAPSPTLHRQRSIANAPIANAPPTHHTTIMRTTPIMLFFGFLALVASCAAPRHSTNVHEVYDTTRFYVYDTTRIVIQRDSFAVHYQEHTSTQEVTTFDPQTGNPIMHQVFSDTDRDLSAILQHLIDSISSAHKVQGETSSYTKDSIDNKCGQAALSPTQQFARQCANLCCVLFVILAVIIAVRYFYHQKN